MEQTEEVPLVDNAYNQLDMSPRKEELASIIKQIDPSILTEDLIHALRGEVWNHHKAVWEQKYTPMMNAEGIQRFVNIFKAFINSNTVLSNLTKQEISRQILFFGDTIINLITTRYKQFEIDRGDFDVIKAMVINMAYIAFKRSYEQGERKFIQPMLQQREIISHNQMAKKPSLWERFKI